MHAEMYGSHEASSHLYSQQSSGLKRSEKLQSVLQRMQDFSENDDIDEWRNDKDTGLDFGEERDDFPRTDIREKHGDSFMDNLDDERAPKTTFQQSHRSGRKPMLNESTATPIRMENVHSIWSAEDEVNEAPREDIIRLRIQEAVRNQIYSSVSRKPSRSGSYEIQRDKTYSGRNFNEAKYRSNTVLNIREIDSEVSEENGASQGKLAQSTHHRDATSDTFHHDTMPEAKHKRPGRMETRNASKETKSTRPSLHEEDVSNDSGESESSSDVETAVSESSDDVSSITGMHSHRNGRR